MKKFVAFLTLTCLCLAGCASSEPADAPTSTTITVSTSVAEIIETISTENENVDTPDGENNMDVTVSVETEPETEPRTDTALNPTEEKVYNVYMFKQDDIWWLKFRFTTVGYPNIAGSSLKIECIDTVCDYKFFEAVEYNGEIVLSPTLTPARSDGDGGIFGFGGEYITVTCEGDSSTVNLRFFYQGGNNYFSITWEEDGNFLTECSAGPNQILFELAE